MLRSLVSLATRTPGQLGTATVVARAPARGVKGAAKRAFERRSAKEPLPPARLEQPAADVSMR